MQESVLADAIRPFWLPQINTVSGKSKLALSDWFAEGAYAISQATEPDTFTLEIQNLDRSTFLNSIAADINRFFDSRLRNTGFNQ